MMADPFERESYAPRNRRERRRAMGAMSKIKYGRCRKFTAGRLRVNTSAANKAWQEMVAGIRAMYSYTTKAGATILTAERQTLPTPKTNGRHR